MAHQKERRKVPREFRGVVAVSYTHLDVYKRQHQDESAVYQLKGDSIACLSRVTNICYTTHLERDFSENINFVKTYKFKYKNFMYLF